MSRGVHAFWFPPLFLDARLLWALSLFKDWVYFGCLSLSFSFFSSVSIIQFATISMVRVVMDIFINQNASKLFIDFLLCVLLKSGTRGFFVLARVCSYCAGVNTSAPPVAPAAFVANHRMLLLTTCPKEPDILKPRCKRKANPSVVRAVEQIDGGNQIKFHRAGPR